ncbi:hypothetical protein Pelo_6162 [Pelomyxa schiedti]|nr:hypothetical protein Pelo_6162 [Pelomyxa schiedti]
MFEAPNNPLAPPTTSSSEPSQVGNIFCITITWNGNTPFNPLVDASGDGLPGLFLRILFSHWFDGIGLVKFASHIQNWEAIVAQISSTDGELLERLFDAIHLHSKKRHALLCVDEILMSNSSSKSEEHSIAICKQLGNLLDKHRATSEDPNASVLMVLFSCLDKGWAKELKTHSGRQILFSQMDPIQFRLCVKLFEQHFLRFGEQAKAGLMTLLMDTGGIPCLLASAEQWLRNDKTALQWLAGRSYSLTSIIDGTRAGCFDDDTLEIVSAVVCARDVNPLTLIGETSFSRLISRGHLYCLGHKPCTSVITLLQFASEHNAPPVHTFEDVITLLDDNSGKTLEQVSILLNFILNPTVSWASGQALEDFCTLHPFLLTLCNAKEGDRTFTVCSMFGSPKFRRCVEAVVGEMAVFPRIPHFLCWNVPYEGQSHHFYWWAKNHVNLLRLGSVVRCCHNNPGFETVFLLASACTKDKFIICLEAKYSEEKSTSTLSAEDIVDKWRNTQDQIQPLLQTTAWGGSTVILMIVALRQLPKTLNFQLPPDANIVIVDRQQFVKYLGPTIGRRFESADQVQFEDFIYRETTTASHS